MITEEDKDKLIATLTLQLQEKDKELEYYKSWFADDDYEKHNQDKISFAVEKLQEAKSLLEEKYTYDVEESDFAVVYEYDVDEIIDKQIKAIKEMK